MALAGVGGLRAERKEMEEEEGERNEGVKRVKY
jgi:hypothetical protein